MPRLIEPLPDGGARVRLRAGEHALLRSLPHQLEAVLTGKAGPQEVHERLLPAAYDDPEAEAEYRELMRDPLVDEKIDAIRVLAERLDEAAADHADASASPRATAPSEDEAYRVVDLDPDDLESWLLALNDARLALGMVAGIESEEHWDEIDASEPTHAALLYLGALQEELIAVMSGRFGT